MTYQEREEIFSSEVLTTADIAKLFRMDLPTASTTLNHIKRGLQSEGKTLRIDQRGKLHTQDYLDFFGITPDNVRYTGQCGGGEQ